MDFTFEELQSSIEWQDLDDSQRQVVEDSYATNFWNELQQDESYTSASEEELDKIHSYFDNTFKKGSYIRGVEDYSAGDVVKDIGVSFMKGGAAIPSVLGQAAEFVGAETAGEKLKEIGKTGVEYWEEKLSSGTKEVIESPFLSKEEGEWFGENPVKKVIFGAAEAVPGMIAMAPGGAALGVGTKALKLAPKLTKALQGMGIGSKRAGKLAGHAEGLLTYGTSESVYSGLQNAAEMGNQVEDTPYEELAKSPIFNELVGKHNGDKGKAKEEFRDKVEKATMIKTSGATLAGSLAGGGGVLARIAGKAGKGVGKEAIGGMVQEAAQETGQSALENIAQNVVTRDYIDPSKTDIYAGTLEAAAMGGATGGLLGLGGGAFTTKVQPKDILETQSIDEAINVFDESVATTQAEKIAQEAVQEMPTIEVGPVEDITEAYDKMQSQILDDKAGWLTQEARDEFGGGIELTPQEASIILEKKKAGLELTESQRAKEPYIDAMAQSFTEPQIKREEEVYEVPDTLRDEVYQVPDTTLREDIEKAAEKPEEFGNFVEQQLGRPLTAEESAQIFEEDVIDVEEVKPTIEIPEEPVIQEELKPKEEPSATEQVDITESPMSIEPAQVDIQEPVSPIKETLESEISPKVQETTPTTEDATKAALAINRSETEATVKYDGKQKLADQEFFQYTIQSGPAEGATLNVEKIEDLPKAVEDKVEAFSIPKISPEPIISPDKEPDSAGDQPLAEDVVVDAKKPEVLPKLSKAQVKEQIAQGKFVPAETLREYPDLVKDEDVQDGNVKALHDFVDIEDINAKFDSYSSQEIDDIFMEAIERGDKATAQVILNKSQGKDFKVSDLERGQGIHAPSSPEYGSPAWELTMGGMYPDDVYSANGLRYYGTGEGRMDIQAYQQLQRIKNKPNAQLKIYRAVDKDYKGGIVPGDWVTNVRQYAKEHGESNIPDGYKIISKTVTAKDIYTSGDSWLEWGYHPQEFWDRLIRKDKDGNIIPPSKRLGFKEKSKVKGKADVSQNTVKDISKSWDEKGIDNFISERDDKISLSKIIVPEEKRGTGIGTEALNELIDYADKTGKTIVVDPSTDFGGKSMSAVKRFYKKAGFVLNRGKAKDFEISELMYRVPKKKAESLAEKAKPSPKKAIIDLAKQDYEKLGTEEYIRKHGSKELKKSYFLLREILPKDTMQSVKVEVNSEPNKSGVVGSYIPGTKTVEMYDNTILGSVSPEQFAATLLHEVVHGITYDKLQYNPEISAELDTLRDKVAWELLSDKEYEHYQKYKGDPWAFNEFIQSERVNGRSYNDIGFDGQPKARLVYMLLTNDELLANATHPEMQKALSTIPVEKRYKFMQKIKDILMRLFGWTKKQYNAYEQAMSAIGRLNAEIEFEFEGKPLEAFAEEPVTFAETEQPITEQDYTENKKQNRSIKEKFVQGAAAVKNEIKGGTDKFLGAISTRLANINEKLKFKLRRLDFDTNTKATEYVKKVQPLLEKSKKMNRDDLADWDYARKNSDKAKIAALIDKYDMQTEYDAYRDALDMLRQEAIDVGYDVGLIDEYAPRVLKDAKGFLEAMGKEGDWPVISRRLNERATELGITVAEMTPEMKADMVAQMAYGGPMGMSKPGATKMRTIKKIPPPLNKYYMDSNSALTSHIHGMVKAIEARKFFGKVPENISKAKRQMHTAQSALRKEQKKTDPNEKRIANLESNIKAYQNTLDAFKFQRDFTDTIFGYVADLVQAGEVSAKDEQNLINILNARFTEKGTHGLVQAYKNLSYIDTMGSPISAITQIGDQAWSWYEHGIIGALKQSYKSLRGKSKISKEDVGIERIAQEFADPGTLANAVNKVFKIVGLEKMDTIGKESMLNGALEKYQKRSRTDEAKLRKELEPIFENETDSVIDDLQNGEVSENVKFLTFSKLLDYQPAALSEMPEQYLKAGNGRIFYMLKSFTLKQFDIFRNISYNKIKNGNRSEKIEGMKNLVKMGSMFVLANAGADEIKDWMLGRETDLSDRVVDNVLRLFGVSKFITWQARTEGLPTALFKQALPPFKFGNALYKDVITAGDGKGLETLGSTPVIGKLAYWHMGRGTSKRGDLWDRRLSKEKKKLNDIKDRVERHPAEKSKYAKELAELKRVNRLQGKLNSYRKRINKLKAKPDSKENKQTIQVLEKRRTNLIKSYLEKMNV